MVIEGNHIQILSVRYLISFTSKLQLTSLEVGVIAPKTCSLAENTSGELRIVAN